MAFDIKCNQNTTDKNKRVYSLIFLKEQIVLKKVHKLDMIKAKIKILENIEKVNV